MLRVLAPTLYLTFIALLAADTLLGATRTRGLTNASTFSGGGAQSSGSTIAQGWMSSAGGGNGSNVIANPTTGTSSANSLRFAPTQNQINSRFRQQSPELNAVLGDKRFMVRQWGGEEMSFLNDRRAPIDLEDNQRKDVLERKMFGGAGRRWGFERNEVLQDERAYFSNWDQMKETVLVRKYSEAEVGRFGDVDREALTQDVDKLSLRDLNRYQFSSNRPDGPIPVQSVNAPAQRGLPPPSPIFDPDPIYSQSKLRSSGNVDRAPLSRPSDTANAPTPLIRSTGEGPPKVEKGNWTIEARVKE
ncbi:MAG: hypothetical protein ACFBZ8_08870 [Opitutales bacterium]